MTENISSSPFLPELNGRALDFIKICAALFMVIDHINHILFMGQYPVMLIFGRAVFPLFCYAQAVALSRMNGDKRLSYIVHLTLLAIVCEPISHYTKTQDIGNVLFTLALGALVTEASRTLRDRYLFALYAFGLLSIALPSMVEFGIPGILLPSAIYQAFKDRRFILPFLALLIAALNSNDLITLIAEASRPSTLLLSQTLLALGAGGLSYMIIRLATSLPQTGRLLPRYFLHAFYPIHLIIIKALSFLM